MALLHIPSLGGPSWQSLHHTARACIQGIRDANGADALSNASDLRNGIGVSDYSSVDRFAHRASQFRVKGGILTQPLLSSYHVFNNMHHNAMNIDDFHDLS